MNAETKTGAAELVVKKLRRKTPDPAAIARMIERYLPARLTGDQALDAILGCFEETLRLLKPESGAKSPMAPLLEGLQKAASKRNVPPERLYPLLVERTFTALSRVEPPKEQRKPPTKEAILGAALEVFSEHGFHQATVEEIAERAGLGKGTLYRYFSNKEALFNELVRVRLLELEKRANEMLDERDDALAVITNYLRAYFEFFERNQRLYRVIVQEQLDVGGRMQDLYMKQLMRRAPLLKRKIYEAIQQGMLKDVDFQTVFYGVMGYAHGVIQKWLADDCATPLMDELSTVREVLFYGFVQRNSA